MKIKLLLPILFIILLGSGCANNKIETTPKEPMYSQEEKQMNPPTSSASTQSTEEIKVTGEYHYFLNEAPTGYSKTALGKVCFEPAQKEMVNNGDIFCFQNTDEALVLLKVDKAKIDKNCKYYYGIAQVLVRNLSDNKESILKSSPCFSSGTCPLNEAVLDRVEDAMYQRPQCRK